MVLLNAISKSGLWLQANRVEPARFMADMKRLGIEVKERTRMNEWLRPLLHYLIMHPLNIGRIDISANNDGALEELALAFINS